MNLPSIPIEVLSNCQKEIDMIEGDSICHLAFNWLIKAQQDNSLEELLEKVQALSLFHLYKDTEQTRNDFAIYFQTHMLYLALDNSLQDCCQLPNGDICDTELVQDYKRLSKHISNGNKVKHAILTARTPSNSYLMTYPS